MTQYGMRFNDELQIDRAYHRAREIIERLRGEIERLRMENTQLKNRPEPEPIIKTSGLIVKVTKDKLQDDLNKWTSQHFILYFSTKFKEKYNEYYSLKKDDWKVYGIRIKQFRNQNEDLGVGLNANDKFKELIDWCFERKFNKKFIANIAAVTSSKILMEFRISSGMSQKPDSYEDLIDQVPKTRKSAREKLLKDAF